MQNKHKSYIYIDKTFILYHIRASAKGDWIRCPSSIRIQTPNSAGRIKIQCIRPDSIKKTMSIMALIQRNHASNNFNWINLTLKRPRLPLGIMLGDAKACGYRILFLWPNSTGWNSIDCMRPPDLIWEKG